MHKKISLGRLVFEPVLPLVNCVMLTLLLCPDCKMNIIVLNHGLVEDLVGSSMGSAYPIGWHITLSKCWL